jgi:site-specific recombinase XerD
VKTQGLSSADTIEYRTAALRKRFGNRPLAKIKTADIEDFVAALKQPALLTKYHKDPRLRRPATINRYLSLLRHMFAWAVAREFIERTPFQQGNESLVKEELEDNRRHRCLAIGEEKALMASAPEQICLLVLAALDTGLRRGEMLAPLGWWNLARLSQFLHSGWPATRIRLNPKI